jgi:uncharacterized membrane protein
MELASGRDPAHGGVCRATHPVHVRSIGRYSRQQFQALARMSATISHPSIALANVSRPLRFGAESGTSTASGEHSVQWVLKRNCSATPRQMVGFYASLCLISFAIAAAFWFEGATLVMPFASIEILAVGTALLIYSRHATDSESIRLMPGRLTVEHASAGRVERVEFAPAWVRVEPEHGDRSLIELSGQGHRISVGRFTRPELRRQLAEELRWALRRWQWLSGQSDGSAGVESASKNEYQDKSEN